jgi:hypothetical protein
MRRRRRHSAKARRRANPASPFESPRQWGIATCIGRPRHEANIGTTLRFRNAVADAGGQRPKMADRTPRPPRDPPRLHPGALKRVQPFARASDAWAAFLADMERAREKIGLDAGTVEDVCYYRGHGNREWPLLPSLFRNDMAPGDPGSPERHEHFLGVEYKLYFEFRARARELHGHQLTSWDVLFAMQHFRAPTRLLDWTETFAVALYFALTDRPPGGHPCIWLLNPRRLNERSREYADTLPPKYLGVDPETHAYASYEDRLMEKKMGWNEPVALYPDLTNARIHAQRGSFTIHGDVHEPLRSGTASPAFLQRVDIPESAFEDAERFMALAGVDDALLFPDLEGLSNALRRKYRYK